jgi:hypothetical protein
MTREESYKLVNDLRAVNVILRKDRRKVIAKYLVKGVLFLATGALLLLFLINCDEKIDYHNYESALKKITIYLGYGGGVGGSLFGTFFFGREAIEEIPEHKILNGNIKYLNHIKSQLDSNNKSHIKESPECFADSYEKMAKDYNTQFKKSKRNKRNPYIYLVK